MGKLLLLVALAFVGVLFVQAASARKDEPAKPSCYKSCVKKGVGPRTCSARCA